MKFWDKNIHDNQHWLSSIAGLIVGLGIFLIYYFMSRIETQHAVQQNDKQSYYPWEMPWYYYVIGIFLFMTTVSAIACMLSAGIRPRMK